MEFLDELFNANHENLNEDRPILSATKPHDSRFWRYNVYADIRGGSQDLCKFSIDLRMPVSIYKERYDTPYTVYSLSSSRRWFVTISYTNSMRV